MPSCWERRKRYTIKSIEEFNTDTLSLLLLRFLINCLKALWTIASVATSPREGLLLNRTSLLPCSIISHIYFAVGSCDGLNCEELPSSISKAKRK